MPQPRKVEYRQLKANVIRRPPLPALARQLETAIESAAAARAAAAAKPVKKSRSRRS